MFKLKKKYKIYRAFRVDIWGRLLVSKYTKASYFYITNYDKQSFLLPSAALIRRRRLLSVFYGGLRSRDYISSFGREFFDATKYRKSISKWERRLPTIIYRANFSLTVLEANALVMSGLVSVNKCIKKERSSVANYGDIVEIVDSYKSYLYERLLANLTNCNIFSPLHLHVHYPTLAVLVMCDSEIPFYPS